MISCGSTVSARFAPVLISTTTTMARRRGARDAEPKPLASPGEGGFAVVWECLGVGLRRIAGHSLSYRMVEFLRFLRAKIGTPLFGSTPSSRRGRKGGRSSEDTNMDV